MILYFLRHANAGEKYSDPRKDEKRPLDETGIEQCQIVGRALARLQVQVDAVISSPLKRAMQTASLVANEMNHEDDILLENALRPEANFEQFRLALGKLSKADALLIVGHNPNQSQFLRRLIGGSDKLKFELKKGSVARLLWKRRMAELEWYLTPKLLKSLQPTSNRRSDPTIPRK